MKDSEDRFGRCESCGQLVDEEELTQKGDNLICRECG